MAAVWLVIILVSGHGGGDNHGPQPGPTIAYVIVALVAFPILLVRERSRSKRHES